jgi:ferric-dicitrate binding protein FerR (iron transport regulator)
MERKENSTTDILIANFLGGNSSAEDIEKLEAWVKESEENKAYYLNLKNIWELSEAKSVSSEAALEKVLSRISSKDKKPELWEIWQKVAAILVIPLLIASLWPVYKSFSGDSKPKATLHETVAAFGSYTHIHLSDGSSVWLNSGSSLKYPDTFTSENRTVYLNGEGYFEVKSDTASPFYVNTPSFSVRATGTRFNVMSYTSSRNPSVTLIEGKVAVQKEVSVNKRRLISVLKPNQHMIYDTINGSVTIQNEDIYKFTAWKDGKLVFRNDLMAEVARRISQQYNVDIELEGEQIKNYRFRATFENEPLDELLRLLKISSPVDYRDYGSKPLTDGSFSKRKIVLFSTEEATK